MQITQYEVPGKRKKYTVNYHSANLTVGVTDGARNTHNKHTYYAPAILPKTCRNKPHNIICILYVQVCI